VVRLLRATRNSNFYPVHMLKEIANYNYGGGGGDESTIRIVLIQNAPHFSDAEVYDV